jgi:hypothetical protein
MKVLGTSVPIFTSDFEAAIERYGTLTGEVVRQRFELPEGGLRIALLGSVTIIAGSEQAGAARSKTSAQRSSSIRLPTTRRTCAPRVPPCFRVEAGLRPAHS